MISLSSTHLLVLSRSSSFLAYPFNRSVVSSLQFLFILSSFPSLVQPECCQNYVILVPWLSRYTGVVSYSFGSLGPCFMSFNPQGSHNVPCSPFLTECL